MSRLQKIKGMSFPNVYWMKKENIEGTLEYVPKDGDIIIASYPKTGTTWLHYMILQITSRAKSFPPFADLTALTLMEQAGPEIIDSLKGIRIYKHHYRYDMVKKNTKCKVIYIYRCPEDTLASFFHFLCDIYNRKFDLENVLEQFLTGNIEYGSYFEHVLSFYNKKEDENLLLVSYEKLHANRKEGIMTIAKFLGEDYYRDLATDTELLNKVLNNTSFDYMKKNLKFKRPQVNSNDSFEGINNTINFFRKGIVGDGKDLLSDVHKQQLRNKLVEVMKEAEIVKEWIKA